ncbi:MAG: O-antigen ligase family protein [Weeksellaceae bacterium]
MKKILPWLMTGLLLALSLGQLTRIGLLNQPVYIYLYDLIVGFSVIAFIWKRKQLDLHTKLTKAVGLFLGWTVISLVISIPFYSVNEHVIAVLYLLRLMMYFGFMVMLLCFDHKQQLVSTTAVRAFMILVVTGAWVQYLLYPNLGNLAYLGWDPHLYRMVGLFFDPPTAASVFALIALYVYYAKAYQSKVKWILLAILTVMFILTVSRGALLSAVVTITLVFARRVNWKYLIAGMITLFIIWNLVPGKSLESLNIFRTTTIRTRIEDYQKAIEIWQKSPITGIGYNHITPEKNKYEETTEWLEPYNPSHASASFHSSFMVILVTTGVVGLGLFIYMLWQLSTVHQYAQTSLIFLSLFSLFDNVLLLPLVMVVWVILTRALLSADKHKQTVSH